MSLDKYAMLNTNRQGLFLEKDEKDRQCHRRTVPLTIRRSSSPSPRRGAHRGNMEQTVSMLSKSTKLDYKTVQTALERLTQHGMVQKSRRVGNAQTYRFNVENDLHSLLNWAAEYQHGKRNRR